MDKLTSLELARYGAAVCLVGEELYVWRGDSANNVDRDAVYILNINNCKRWKMVNTKPYQEVEGGMQSEIPPGNCSVAMCAVGDVLYTFGGWVCEQFYYSRSNALHKLDLHDMLWRKVVPINPKNGPGMKDKCGMVEYNNKLCIFGGYGYQSDHQLKNKLWSKPPGDLLCWTNELHLYELDTDQWSVPECSGTPPAPCAAFSFTKVDEHRVVLFGGRQCEGRVNELHILNMEQWIWSGPITQLVDIDPWPIARSFHTAVCLQDPSLPCSSHRQLLVLWGMDQDAEPINDLWLLDVDQLLWRQLPCGQGNARVWHNTIAYYPSQGEAHVLTFGGSSKNIFRWEDEVCRLSDVAKMEFGVKSLFRSCVLHIRSNMDQYKLHLLPASITQYISDGNY